MSEPLANQEIELKLRVDPAALARLRDSDLLQQNVRSAMRRTGLVSTYYDTADHRLAARGVALRVRRDGGRLVQTVKAARDGVSAAHVRAEWEVEVATPRPDLTAYHDPAVLEAIGLVLPDELQPFFETRVTRELAVLEWRQGRDQLSVVEVALDKGAIVANGREEPIAEVELELKEGRPEALFEIADALREVAPLALETIDKASRGFRLATGQQAPPSKIGDLQLPPDINVDDGLHAIFKLTLGHWLANEAPARHGGDAEGVHQLRVALRRLRSLLSILKDVLAEASRQRWNSELRWLQQSLSPARDLDVFLEDLLAPVLASPGLQELVSPLHDAALRRRADVYADVAATLASQRYADLALRFAGWVERRGWRQGVDVDVLLQQREPLKTLAASALTKRLKQVRKRGRHFAELDAEHRHRVRIALKKLRYGADYFSPLFDSKRIKPFGKRLSALQDELGHLNDVATARRLVLALVEAVPAGKQRSTASLGAGAVIGWHAARYKTFDEAAVESFDDFVSTKPFWESGGG